MARVQRQPREYLALLGIVGQNPPADSADFYQPTIETLDFIIAAIPQESTFTVNAAAVAGSNAIVTVPEGFVWFVEEAFASVNPSAAATQNQVALARGVANVALLYAIPGQTVPNITGAQGRRDVAFASWKPPLLLRAGQTITGVLNGTDSAGVQTLTTFVVFRAIPV